MKPRYVQQIERGGRKRWRYHPPQDAIDAGVVQRQYLADRRETAFNQAERFNARLDAWRESQEKDLTADKTVDGLIKLYLNSFDYQKLSDVSKNSYQYQLTNLSNMTLRGKRFGVMQYKKITHPMAQELYVQLCERGVTYANRTVSAIRKVYSHGMKFGYVDSNPWKGIDTYTEQSRKVVWTPDHVRQFLEHCYSDFKTRSIGLIVHMAYEWAQRVGDMRLLTWDSIDFENQVLNLEQSKRRALVHIPISDDLMDVLCQQNGLFDWQPYIAPNMNTKSHNGFKPYSVYTISHASRREIERAGLPKELRISDLRRTATTEMVEAGVGMAQIMSVTGHANPQSVKPYMKNSLTSATQACTLRSTHRQGIHISDQEVCR